MTQTNQNRPAVTRFAPSPTGFVHIGGVRTALFAYLHARKDGGTFILRIEDTDKAREVAGSIDQIKESLGWLGLTYDFGPDKPGPFGSCIQSERLPAYLAHAKTLIDKGLAYADPYTPEEVEAFRKDAANKKRPFLMREYRPAETEPWDGTKPLRLRVPEIKRYTWHDAVRGELSAGEEALDDVVLIKADGYPTYNFAHIVDDYEMGVTHIMRGDEFISSTPKFLSIYDALGITPPTFVSLPPILRDDRTKKLGKRDGAKDLLDYRKEGYVPAAMVNFLALTGWNPGTEQEYFSVEELVAAFDISRIQRAGAVVNEDKLLWLNKQHLANLSNEQFLAYLRESSVEHALLSSENTDLLSSLIPIIRERIHVRSEFEEALALGEYEFAIADPEYDTGLLLWKKDPEVSAARPRLINVISLLKTITDWSVESIKATLMPYAEEAGKGEVLWPSRVALSGRAESPDPFTIMFVIGKEAAIRRLETACAKIGE